MGSIAVGRGTGRVPVGVGNGAPRVPCAPSGEAATTATMIRIEAFLIGILLDQRPSSNDVGNETLSILHEKPVGLADGTEERLLLDRHAVPVRRDRSDRRHGEAQ